MQSYYAMLENRQQQGASLPLNYRPTFRSSAIFPVLENEHYHTRVLFMGYWLLKRNIREIGMLITLRNEKGGMLDRSYLMIDSSKAFSIHIKEILHRKGHVVDAFVGSLELEIFSTVDLVFPYPAFVINYFNEHFSTVVHSVGRIYNDVEDMTGNQEYEVREAGFDIYAGSGIVPFVAFTNGPWKNDRLTITYKVINDKNEALEGSFHVENLQSLQTSFLYFSDHIDALETFLGGKKGTINLGHNLQGLFPRFVVGNIDQHRTAMSITHSYYDCSPFNDAKSYWNSTDDRFLDSSIAIPLFLNEGFYTELIIYPIFAVSDFSIGLTFFDETGRVLFLAKQAAKVQGKDQKYQSIDFGQVLVQNGWSKEGVKSVRIECLWEDKHCIPTRVKFGLNVGYLNQLPCNICFAPQLGNPNILLKKSTFKWAPILNSNRSVISLTNSSSLKVYQQSAEVELNFYREHDGESLSRSILIPPFGIYHLDVEQDLELKQFLGDSSGWMTAFSENPNLYGWYFDFSKEGFVGADHLF